MGMGPGGVIDTNQHQQGIDGYRREGIGGHPMNLAIEIHGDDCDSGGETSHRFAELGRIQGHGLGAEISEATSPPYSQPPTLP